GVVESLARNQSMSVDTPTLIQTLTSPSVLDPLRSKLGDAGGALNTVVIGSPPVGGGQRGTTVQGVLQVSARGSDPAEVKAALNGLSETYLAFALSQKQESLGEGLRFLDQQEPLLTAKANQLQAKLAAFRQKHNLLSPETEAGALKGESLGLQTQQRQLEGERTRLLKLRQGVAAGALTAGSFSTGGAGGGGGGGAATSGGGGDGVSVTQSDSDRLTQLQQTENQLAEARAVYRADSPRVRTLEAQRNQLMAQLKTDQLRSLDTALALNATRIGTLAAQVAQVDVQFLKQPDLIRGYEELQQQLKVAQGNLASFLTTRSTFQLEQAQNTAPWKVIAPPAVTNQPVEPKLSKGLLQGLLLGALAGVGVALLRDRFDHVFHHPSEVREELKEPLLGSIPHVSLFEGVREESRFLLEELDKDPGTDSGDADASRQRRYQRFQYQEAMRNLYTSLRFLNTDRPLRSVALTSSLPMEGKSLVNVLLAKTLADLGQRVLLVDGDLRKPQLHHRLGVDNLVGLSNVLSGDLNSWREAIQPVPGHGSWWVLTAGRRPPDPARLLSSQRMRDLVRELADSGQFDLVLYDTPPALGLADAALIAEHLDGLMLLVSLSRVDRSLPREAIDRMRSAGVPLLGVVTNAVKAAPVGGGVYGSAKYGYGGKGYGYGRYGYGGYGYGGDYQQAYAHYGEDPGSKAAGPRLKSRWQKLWGWLDR
ncbi:MAG: polysaccharide biosynthesis tyrosine autokinase, partial [Prochlorococcaceae cyanobacterium]